MRGTYHKYKQCAQMRRSMRLTLLIRSAVYCWQKAAPLPLASAWRKLRTAASAPGTWPARHKSSQNANALAEVSMGRPTSTRAPCVSPRLSSSPGTHLRRKACWARLGKHSSRGAPCTTHTAVPVQSIQPRLKQRPYQGRLRYNDLRAALHLPQRACCRIKNQTGSAFSAQASATQLPQQMLRLGRRGHKLALAAARAASSTSGLATAHSDSEPGSRPAARSAVAVRSSCSAPGSRPVGASTSRSGWLPDTSSSASAAAPARSPPGLHPARCSRRASSAARERSCVASVPDQLPAPGGSACQPNTVPVAPTWAATVATVQPPASRQASGTAGCAGALLPLHRGVLCVTARPGNPALDKQLALGCCAPR